jgi:hypothetical protein
MSASPCPQWCASTHEDGTHSHMKFVRGPNWSWTVTLLQDPSWTEPRVLVAAGDRLHDCVMVELGDAAELAGLLAVLRHRAIATAIHSMISVAEGEAA